MSHYFVGLDLGQVKDFTAIAIVEHIPLPHAPASRAAFHLRHLERLPLGTSYPAATARVGELVASDALRDHVTLLVDATGVGRPVVDMLREAGLRPVPVVVHGGNETTLDANAFWRIPKREMVSSAQVLLQSGQLKIAEGLALTRVLVDELLKFEVKITEAGHDEYGAWREGAHDDLVFAAALACWYGLRHAPRPYEPPVPYKLGDGALPPSRRLIPTLGERLRLAEAQRAPRALDEPDAGAPRRMR